MERRSFQTLQAGRGLAALAVVMFHSATYMSVDPRFWRQPVYLSIFNLGSLGVEYFFVLSGLVMLSAHWKDQGDPSALRSYFWKRFRRIYRVGCLRVAYRPGNGRRLCHVFVD
jgi:exopolysaccharide production protein ExoZ